MGPVELVPYVAGAVLIIAFLIVQIRRDRKREQAAVAELKAKFFPQFIANLKALDRRLGEEEVGEGYVELLSQGWKSILILDFHRYYAREDSIFTGLKQDLEGYEAEVKEFKKTGDERMKEKLAKRKTQIRVNVAKLIEWLERLA